MEALGRWRLVWTARSGLFVRAIKNKGPTSAKPLDAYEARLSYVSADVSVPVSSAFATASSAEVSNEAMISGRVYIEVLPSSKSRRVVAQRHYTLRICRFQAG